MGYELEISAASEFLYFSGAESVEITHLHVSCGGNSALQADDMLLATPGVVATHALSRDYQRVFGRTG